MLSRYWFALSFFAVATLSTVVTLGLRSYFYDDKFGQIFLGGNTVWNVVSSRGSLRFVDSQLEDDLVARQKLLEIATRRVETRSEARLKKHTSAVSRRETNEDRLNDIRLVESMLAAVNSIDQSRANSVEMRVSYLVLLTIPTVILAWVVLKLVMTRHRGNGRFHPASEVDPGIRKDCYGENG